MHYRARFAFDPNSIPMANNDAYYLFYGANRLTSVDGIPYAWDDNGSLLSDGAHTYSYNHANPLVSVSAQPAAVHYGYDGLQERLQQTVGPATTHYTVDLTGDLSQVLADGTRTYLYGTGRIEQYDTAGAAYFLGDALGSVRQIEEAICQG